MVISSNTICALLLAGACVFAGAANAGSPPPAAAHRGGWHAGAQPHHPGGGNHFGRQNYLIVNSAYYRAGGYEDGQGSPEPLATPVVRAAAPEPELRLIVLRQQVAPAPMFQPAPAIVCAAHCAMGPQILDVGRAAAGRHLQAQHQPSSKARVRSGSAHVIALD